jgi:hypothetical protein
MEYETIEMASTVGCTSTNDNIVRLPYPLTGEPGAVWLGCRDLLLEICDETTERARLERKACAAVLIRALAQVVAQ